MQYEKRALTFEEQADLLLQRGLQADRSVLIARLHTVSYYRLNGYLHPYRQQNDAFIPGTSLEQVWRRYTFDRQLRLLVLDAIERVEVSMRTSLIYRHVHAYGPFGYTAPANLPGLDDDRYGAFLARVFDDTRRSGEVFVQHFQSKYGDRHGYLPLWMAAEIMSFGMMFTLLKGVEPAMKHTIAGEYGIPGAVLVSWIGTLNVIRNICAHHGRLWNRELGYKPLIPNGRKYPDWHDPFTIPNNRIFAVLTILKYLLRYAAPWSAWPRRFQSLLGQYTDIPRKNMGFPEDWEDFPIWR